MLSAFRNAFKIPDLRGKILFTVAIIAVYRLGSHLPVPGVDFDAVHQFLENPSNQDPNSAFTLINLFSGGALTQFAIFALGIMPYITSSIIMQLLGVVIPRLEQLQKEGETGRKKIQQYTRYLTVFLAVLQSAGIVQLAHNSGILPLDIFPGLTPGRFALAVLTLTAGTALIMWLGELITQRGVGNGMSIIIFSAIVARLPAEGASILRVNKGFIFGLVCFLGLVIIVAVIFVEQAQRRIPVQYAKRMVGRRMYGGQSTYIPLKVNQAGVIPIIFASSLLYLPTLLASIANKQWLTDMVEQFARTGTHPLYIIFYFVLIIFFAYFYNSIAFNPVDTADNMKKYGGFIPGIRPGRQTAEYLNHILTRITLPGALFLGAVAILPFIALAAGNVQQFPFGGTAILITVGVGLETMKQIESQLLMRNYEGFLR
ncbi:MAG TPA: preprotein translocase subunit SecY [Actinomycetota bacterium]|jgi:preprotein translocase subunit SecY|nr:preprotein translocase subunit SecY [Actinomycetota bacterium]